MSILKCTVHSSYRCGRPPTTDCITCWAAYGRRQAFDAGLRSQGKAKGARGRRSKAKGRGAVVLVATALLEAFRLEDGDVLVKATSQGGCDIHLSPAALRCFPFSIEVKNQESINVWAALAQAAANATPERPPVLFFKRANSLLYVALQADVFLRLLCHEPTPSST